MSRYNVQTIATKDKRVRVVGHPTAPIGMGEHARSVWRALHDVGANPLLVDIYGEQGEVDAEFKDRLAPYMVENLGDGPNIFCINGDEVEQSLPHLKLRNVMSPTSRNIIYPAWELERYPKIWASQLNRFDEVWAPSKFIYDAISEEVQVPVIHMPLACEVQRRGLVSRLHFGIRESSYVFFFAFDFLSYVERKNPFAILEAFRRLIESHPFNDVSLVIKTNNSDRRPDMKAKFDVALAQFRDKVVVIDRTLSELEMKGLIGICDCFISLHRSEGFGRGLSEAMAMAKPVIATAYSGNMDFCNEETAFLVPYRSIPLKPGDYPHWEDQQWAEADIDKAVEFMRDLVLNPMKGKQLGEKARSKLLTNFGYLARGVAYASQLDRSVCANQL